MKEKGIHDYNVNKVFFKYNNTNCLGKKIYNFFQNR